MNWIADFLRDMGILAGIVIIFFALAALFGFVGKLIGGNVGAAWGMVIYCILFFAVATTLYRRGD